MGEKKKWSLEERVLDAERKVKLSLNKSAKSWELQAEFAYIFPPKFQ